MARNSFMSGLAGLVGDIGRARRASLIYSDLSDLSDAQLKARGLARGELPSYAFSRSFGK